MHASNTHTGTSTSKNKILKDHKFNMQLNEHNALDDAKKGKTLKIGIM
jgi:hypothetical protein